ncbi:PQQ-binding-like beta-propeller repeat protein [Wolbachia endosymbiont of Cruorifilaria tuberocauda]|uniref:outer membrane protein assembly factor BamB family protein n=1 Tax=Wolbachia endosymbiont of Cruorifilaria tuberocauda TaxID=1812111 RepID=UPI00158CAD93|nr:PQQ-binding-like beta-propeller repeat protein [Wolbachia endosymbiont of Cruorifilaria tuberocauda]QKX01913.1 PQQ-binding-like beta-propeller repeat protein [Wolbachia endosymbiont of Cruorifilaria tuberocauda]
MKVIVVMILLLCSNYTIASELVNIDRKLSQGYVAPVLVEDSIIFVDKYGTLYSFDINNFKVKNWELRLSDKKKIGNMSISSYGKNIFFIVNNFLYIVDIKTGEIQWEKELRAPIRGKAVVMYNKLIVLTIDSYLYVFDIKDGSLIWAYQNGINEVRGLHYVSPTVSNDMVIVPFSNGELIAFDGSGKKLWSQKLDTSILDTKLTDVTTTPRTFGDILIATNNSYIYGINIKLGNVLWSKPIQAKSVSHIVPYHKEQRASGRIFIITKDNKIIGIDVQNGQAVWASNLIKNTQFFALVMYNNTLWVLSNKGLMFAFPEHKNIGKAIKIPRNVFHAPVFTHDKIYITTEGNGAFSLENRSTFYG